VESFEGLIAGKRVAIVGPALYMQGSGYGKEIDSHDVVARINRGIESIENFSADIGKRTDVYYSCLIERAQQTGRLDPIKLKNLYKIKCLVAPPDSDIKGIARTTRFHSLVDQNTVNSITAVVPIRIISHQFHTELAHAVSCKPNTGFLSIYDLLANRPAELSVYGFSFYLDGFLPGQKSGVEEEKGCTEQEFADMAFVSKRHVQINMWNHAKKTLLNNPIVKLDKTLKAILSMEEFSREKFNELDL
jgi:hypothetical protein